MSKLEPPESELDQAARTIKAQPPSLVSLDDDGVNAIIDDQHELKRVAFVEYVSQEYSVEMMRGAFAKYVHMLRGGILRDLRAQRVLNYWSRHAQNVQAHRRAVEVCLQPASMLTTRAQRSYLGA